MERTDDAHDACASGDAKKAKARLKQTVRGLIQYSHRLRSRSSRRRVDRGILEGLATSGDAIQRDARSLRTSVRCPDDA